MSKKIIVLIAAVVALAGMATASLVSDRSAVNSTAIVVSQAAAQQIGGFFQEGTSYPGFGQTIHCTVGGVPFAGSYVLFEEPAGTEYILVSGTKQRTRRTWRGVFRANGSGALMGMVFVQRDLFSDSTVQWAGGAWVEPIPWKDQMGIQAVLNGADFNCSGSNGAFSITVSP